MKTAAPFLALILPAAGLAQANLVSNGGFESPLHAGNDGTDPDDWMVIESATGANPDRQVRTRDNGSLAGSMGAQLGAGQSEHAGEMWQTVATVAGQEYDFRVWAAVSTDNAHSGAENFRVELRDGAGTGGAVLATVGSGGQLATTWKPFTTTVVASSAELTIHIRDISTAPAADSNDILLDEVSLVPVEAGLGVDVEGNKAEHRATAIANAWKEDTTQVILAYEGEPLDTSAGGGLEEILDILDGEDPDFGMISLVRILYLSDRHENYSYDTLILPELQNFLYWPEPGQPVEYAYWSENHLIMWLSTAYLLNQRQGWEMDALTEDRLRHWLALKLEYGFYEWNAPVYWAFTLSALLNLADFADDADIRADAEAVAKRLLKEMLWLTNDEGVFFAVAGRGAYNKVSQPFNYFLSPVIHLLTGLNARPTGASLPSGFLATSGVACEDVAATWQRREDRSYAFGHAIDANVHAGFPRQDRTFFQWSAGGYFHPAVADDTAYTSNYYDIDVIPQIPIFLANGGSSLAATFSRSSVLSRASFHLYKNDGVVLSSVEAYYPGYFGYQQFPWMATVDDLAIFTQSGEVTTNWNDRSHDNRNTHLPRVMQDENVALIMYWPNVEISAAYDTDVSLHWKDADFDETATHDRWVIGRRNDSYVAVYRHRTGTKNGWYFSESNFGRQYWGVVVGNANTHGSFANFVEVIEASSNTDSYTWTFSGFEYYARITVDGKTIKYTWKD